MYIIMANLKEKIDHYKKLSQSIESSIAENAIEETGILLQQYSKAIKNSSKYCFQAIVNFQNGDVESAISELKEGVKEHPFSFSIYYNLGFLYNVIQEFELALESFFYAVKYSLSDEEKKEALNEIQSIIKESKNIKSKSTLITQSKIVDFERMLKQQDARIYPIDEKQNSLIRKPQHKNSTNEYMINMYKAFNINDVDLNSRIYFKSELIKGKTNRNKKRIKTDTPVVIPISVIDHSPTIEIKVNGEKYKFKKDVLKINQFHYIRIDEPGEIEVSADFEIFIGNPINLKPEKKPVKLYLKIFIDGLSYEFLEENDLKAIMPATYGFFGNGFISQNCYTTSEWTLPSKSSINTGLYATQHKMLQPNHKFTYYDTQKLLAEYFQEQGYYCTNISTNWRTTPTLGYHRGFNRMIYQNFLGGMDAKEVVMETVEHLLSFGEINNFMTISLMDLHNVPDEIENHLFSQVNTDITDRINKNKKGLTSVQTQYDESKVAKYREEIKRVDGILSVLYDFLEKSYPDGDFVVTLHSDHGQTFLEDNFNLLSDNRLKVPFMMRGKNVPVGESKEVIETVDILPSILKSCEIEIPENIDGRLPQALGGEVEREFTFTQIIHPNQTYKVRINEESISYFLETKHEVLDDLSICLEDYHSYIIDKKSKMDITEENIDKKNRYDEYVFSQIKDMLRWSP